MIWHLRACGGSLRPRFSRFNRRESAGLRSEGRRGAHGGSWRNRDVPLLFFDVFATGDMSNGPSHSPFSEYKQRAGYTELEPSIMSLLIYHSSSRDLRRFSFYMIHTIERLLPCSTELHFSSLAPILFILSCLLTFRLSFPSSSRRLFLFVPFSLFGQLLCIVREPSARS